MASVLLGSRPESVQCPGVSAARAAEEYGTEQVWWKHSFLSQSVGDVELGHEFVAGEILVALIRVAAVARRMRRSPASAITYLTK